MFNINLSIYKESKQYFQLFDILLKDLDINKEAFLKDVGISPSSYRKARTIEQNIGDKIVEQLCRALGYKKASVEFIEEFENFFNKIYFNVYYKIYKTYDDDLKIIDKMIEDNYIIKPILYLLKLFLLSNSKTDVSKIINENKEMYNDIKNYLFFFNDDLLEIVDILSLAFETKIQEEIVMKTYKNSLAYYSLASRLCSDKRYVESLFIGKKAEEVLVREKNYKRLLYLNVKMMHCLNSIHSYQDCYDLAYMQLFTLQSFVDTGYEYNHTTNNLAVCCLPLKKYKYISDLLLGKKHISLTELCCLLVAKFKLDQNDYEKLYSSYFNIMEESDRKIIEGLNNYLKTGDKKELWVLENPKIMENITYAIKRTQIE